MEIGFIPRCQHTLYKVSEGVEEKLCTSLRDADSSPTFENEAERAGLADGNCGESCGLGAETPRVIHNHPDLSCAMLGELKSISSSLLGKAEPGGIHLRLVLGGGSSKALPHLTDIKSDCSSKYSACKT